MADLRGLLADLGYREVQTLLNSGNLVFTAGHEKPSGIGKRIEVGMRERLGVSVRHMRRLVAERRIPYVKWGHLLRFDPDEVDRWIEERAIAPARWAARR